MILVSEGFETFPATAIRSKATRASGIVISEICLLPLSEAAQARVTGSNTGRVTFVGQEGAGGSAAITRGSRSKRTDEIVSSICNT